jgi:hypothetical protein
MAKKVIQFPTDSALRPPTPAGVQPQVTIQIGRQRYSLETACKITKIPPTRPGVGVLVETRFFRLRKAAAIGASIDGWRICWVGGWDAGKVFFVVMGKRTIMNGDRGMSEL